MSTEIHDRFVPLIARITSDNRLKPFHIALYIALCHSWGNSRFANWFHVSRGKLMTLSRIRSITTYHKTITDLVNLGYIGYRPSYHPVKASIVSLTVIRARMRQGENSTQSKNA